MHNPATPQAVHELAAVMREQMREFGGYIKKGTLPPDSFPDTTTEKTKAVFTKNGVTPGDVGTYLSELIAKAPSGGKPPAELNLLMYLVTVVPEIQEALPFQIEIVKVERHVMGGDVQAGRFNN